MCSSTTFALRHTQISLSGILWHFRPPSRHLLLNTHDTNMEFLQLSRHLLLNTHDTNMEFLQLSGPLLDIFLFFSKTKNFHSHPWYCDCVRYWVDVQLLSLCGSQENSLISLWYASTVELDQLNLICACEPFVTEKLTQQNMVKNWVWTVMKHWDDVDADWLMSQLTRRALTFRLIMLSTQSSTLCPLILFLFAFLRSDIKEKIQILQFFTSLDHTSKSSLQSSRSCCLYWTC